MRLNKTFNARVLLKLIIPCLCLMLSIALLVTNASPQILVTLSIIPFLFVTGSTWRLVKDIQSGIIELIMASGFSKITYMINFLGIRSLFNVISAFVIFLVWGIIHAQFDQAIFMYLLVIALFILSIGMTLITGLFTHSTTSTISIALLSGVVGFWIVKGLYDPHAVKLGILFLIAMDFAIVILSAILIIIGFRTKWARWNERTIQEDSSPSPTQVVFQRFAEKLQDFLEKLE